jgi:hypothetical protein
MAPRAEFADIADARHMVAGDSNKAFSGAVLEFLTRHGSGGGSGEDAPELH